MSRKSLYTNNRLGRLLVTEEAVYGLVLVAGMIVIASERDVYLWETMVSVLATVLVFFAAHVYAGTLSRMIGQRRPPIWRSLRQAANHSVGLLVMSIPPLVVLGLGAVGVLTPRAAIWGALVVTVVLLVVDGWLMAATRTHTARGRIIGAAVSGVFGAVLIGLKALIHF